jgi:hypothetical protein
MQLIQILLPLKDNHGQAFPGQLFRKTKAELTRRFKGLTVYSRAPAEGIWKPGTNTRRDEIVVFEVMAPALERRWWKQYRSRLERSFRQQSIVVRAQEMVLL